MTGYKEDIRASLKYAAACPCGHDALWCVTLVAMYDTNEKYADKFLGFDTRYDVQCEACLAREEVLVGAA